MRSTRLLVTAALSTALLVPIGAVGAGAADEFTATLSLKAYTNVRDVALTAGKQNVPAGKTVNAWFISETGEPAPAANAQGWKAAPTTYKLDAVDGAHTVFVWARATGAVVSARGSDTTFLDRVAPVIDSVVTTPAQNVAPPVITNRNVSLAIVASDPGEPSTGSGVGRYAVVNGVKMPPFGTDAWKLGPIPGSVSHKVTTGNGIKNVSVFVRDRAGNASLITTVQFNLQVAGPTIALTQLAAYTKTNKPSLKLVAVPPKDAQFLVKITETNDQPTAPGAGAGGWKTAISSVTLPSTGINFVWAWAKDDNGSISALPAVDSIIWDNVAPTASFDITSTSPTASRTVNIAGSGLDNPGGSGVVKYAVKIGTGPVTNAADWKDSIPATFLLPAGSGDKTVALFVRDAAGNVSAPASETITLTLAPPQMVTFNIVPVFSSSLKVTIQRTQAAGGGSINGFYISQSSTTPAYNIPGWSTAPGDYTFPAGTTDGLKTLYIWVKDSNNSVSVSPLSDTVTIERVAPTATLTVNNDGTASPSLVVGGSDGGSGVAKYALVVGPSPVAPISSSSAWKDTAAAATVTLSSGSQLVTAFTRDVAGNVSVVVSGVNSHTVTVTP